MNIVYASNDAYVPFLGISLLSLLKNNEKMDRINIFVLADGISEKNKGILNDMVIRYGR